MLNLVHNLWVKVEEWLERLRTRNRAIHHGVIFLAIGLPIWVIGALADKLVEESEWGTIMKFLLYPFCVLVLFFPTIFLVVSEIRAARAKKIQLSITGWVFGLVVMLAFAYQQFLPMLLNPRGDSTIKNGRTSNSNMPSPQLATLGGNSNEAFDLQTAAKSESNLGSHYQGGDSNLYYTSAIHFGRAYMDYFQLATNDPQQWLDAELTASSFAGNLENSKRNPQLWELAYRVAAEYGATRKSSAPTEIETELFNEIGLFEDNPAILSTPAPSSTTSILAQWYLKIDYVQCDPPLNMGQNRIYSFRIKTEINGEQIDSYPHGLIAYTGITNILLGGDWTRLDPHAKQYAVQMLVMRLNARPGMENDINNSNVLTSAGNDQNPFSVAELPAIATNYIPLGYPLQDRRIVVVYEITNDWK